MKLFISGISGIGKTTLANSISKEFDIPFVIGSTKLLWNKYGIKNHNEIISMCNNQPKIGLKFQNEVLDYRLEMMNQHKDFVTDRSPIDNVVYTLTQLSHIITEDEFKIYLDKCSIAYNFEDVRHLHLSGGYSTLKDTPLENDNMRVTSQYYQLMVNSIFDMVIKGNWLNIDYYEKFREVRTWDMNTRMKTAGELILKI